MGGRRGESANRNAESKRSGEFRGNRTRQSGNARRASQGGNHKPQGNGGKRAQGNGGKRAQGSARRQGSKAYAQRG